MQEMGLTSFLWEGGIAAKIRPIITKRGQRNIRTNMIGYLLYQDQPLYSCFEHQRGKELAGISLCCTYLTLIFKNFQGDFAGTPLFELTSNLSKIPHRNFTSTVY